MKSEGSEAKLTVRWWHGEIPVAGDVLRTRSGRRYLVIEPRFKRDGALKLFKCIVLPRDALVTGRTFTWQWAQR